MAAFFPHAVAAAEPAGADSAAPAPAEDKPVAGPPADDPSLFESRVRPVLAQYCLSCHGPEKKKGDLDLSKFQQAKPGKAKDVWQEVASRMHDKEMPPEKKPQPSEEQRKAVVAGWRSRSACAQIDCHKIASDETSASTAATS